MSYLALYRRYRPKTFDRLIGQEHVVKTLVNQIENQRFGHAYLFTGTRGTGKTSVAKIFAKAINCEHPINGSPCGTCSVCENLADPSNIDIIEIDAASNNGVNEIRELKENVQYPPVSCKYKVYIIDEVHKLTGAAFNALLKTLEEPPKHAVFVLATTEVHKIPATILSRCMRFDFRLVSLDQISSLIAEIFNEQGKKYDNEAIIAIAKAGDGSVRDALSIADIAVSYGEGKLTYDNVMDILGSTNSQTINKFIESILTGNVGTILDMIEKLCEQGKSVGVLIKDVNLLLRDLLIVKTMESAKTMLALPEERFLALKNLSTLANEERILRAMEIFSEAESTLKYSNHPRIVFETAAVKASRPETDYNIDALLSRIKTLEEKLEKGVNIVYEKIEQKQMDNSTYNNVVEYSKKVGSISQEKVDKIKAKILTYLRTSGSEMLWNIMQSVNIEVTGNVLSIIPIDSTDVELLLKKDNTDKIKNALSEYLDFEIEVKESRNEKILSAVDDATEKIKQIFGDDIVIIKP